MKEIEIKARLRNKAEVMKKLKSLGCVFEQPIVQSDVVYAEKVGTLAKFRSNKVFLRVRVKNKSKIIFTLKKPLTNELDAIEHEVEINSKEEMENIISILGYKEAVRVNKTRIITHYNGCEICIDDVENLGIFIEMEKLTKKGDSKKIQDQLFKFFKSIGIAESDRVMFGYDILMLHQNLL